MNPKTVKIIKIILCSICAAFFASYLVWATVAGLGSDEVVCGSLVIDITDSDTYNFINNNDIKDKLSEAHIDPVGRKASHNLADSVEKTINSISFVKNSECYIGDNGVMTLEITQRQPVLMVKTPVEDYYIDSERKKMPVSPHHTALLPVVTGRVKENMAKSVIFDLVKDLGNDEFYKNHIDQIHVGADGDYFLGTKKGVNVIKIGTPDNIYAKLGKLRAWYEQYPGFAWSDKYRMVDVSYEGLIYATK